MYKYVILEIIGWLVIAGVIGFLLFKARNRLRNLFSGDSLNRFGSVFLAAALLIFAAGIIFKSRNPYPIHFAMPPMMHAHTPDKNPPSLPLLNVFNFLINSNRFERVDDIGADPNEVPEPINRNKPQTIDVNWTAREVISEIYPGIYNNYWTFEGQVPGPMLRVRQNDTVNFTINNHESSLHPHNIDFHAATGPGGGAAVTNVAPGESKSFTWKALQPGLYIYHCASSNVSVHNAHGKYGLVLVEPKEGLEPVDKEFYIVQGELYTQGGLGKKVCWRLIRRLCSTAIRLMSHSTGKSRPRYECKPKSAIKYGCMSATAV